jgi:hypothetical protein
MRTSIPYLYPIVLLPWRPSLPVRCYPLTHVCLGLKAEMEFGEVKIGVRVPGRQSDDPRAQNYASLTHSLACLLAFVPSFSRNCSVRKASYSCIILIIGPLNTLFAS